MQTTLRRRIGVAALTLVIPTLAACGFHEQTDTVYQPAVGINNRSGEVDVLGALVVSASPGTGVFIATLTNENPSRDDQLAGVQGDGVTLGSGVTPTIPAGGLVNLASAQYGGIPVTGAAIKAGGFVTVRLTFAHAAAVTMNVPIVTDDGPYATITPASPPNSVAAQPAEVPSASPSPSASASAGG